MKPVFRCDYCDFIGTEPEVKKHEIECSENYTRRSCFTCTHRGYSGFNFTCDCGVDIPAGKIREFCPKYEKEESRKNPLDEFVNLMLGGKR